MLRTPVALVAGLASFFALVAGLDALAMRVCTSCFSPDHAHVTSVPLLSVMLVYWGVGVGLGTAVAARLASHARWFHSLLVGLILILFLELNTLSTMRSGADPWWWHVLALATSVPLGFAGARIGASLGRRREAVSGAAAHGA